MRPTRVTAIFLSIFGVAMLAGCAAGVSKVPESAETTGPAPGKALVYLIRKEFIGPAAAHMQGTEAPIFDNDEYIGSLRVGTHIALQATPGRHVFMGLRRDVRIGDRPDFVIADLVAGKTYYIRIDMFPNMRIDLEADNGQYRPEDTKRLIASTAELRLNEKGRRWGEANAASAKRLREYHLPKFEAELARERRLADRFVLRADSGR